MLNNHVKNYFADLFSSEVVETDPNILDKVETKVTGPMNDMLVAHYS